MTQIPCHHCVVSVLIIHARGFKYLVISYTAYIKMLAGWLYISIHVIAGIPPLTWANDMFLCSCEKRWWKHVEMKPQTSAQWLYVLRWFLCDDMQWQKMSWGVTRVVGDEEAAEDSINLSEERKVISKGANNEFNWWVSGRTPEICRAKGRVGGRAQRRRYVEELCVGRRGQRGEEDDGDTCRFVSSWRVQCTHSPLFCPLSLFIGSYPVPFPLPHPLTPFISTSYWSLKKIWQSLCKEERRCGVGGGLSGGKKVETKALWIETNKQNERQ